MKLSLRKSWWWLTPLAVVLAIVATVVPQFVRHSAQRQVAQRIVDLGGNVDVRWEGPASLFHLAPDTCRDKYLESGPIAAWGPNWLREVFGALGFASYVDTWNVADRVHFCINNEPSKFVGSRAADMPDQLTEVARLSGVQQMLVECVVDCEIDSSSLPQSLKRLIIISRAPDHLKLDLSNLPAALEELHIHGQDFFNIDLQVDISGIAALRNLHRLELENLRLNDSSLAVLRKNVSLRRLSLRGNLISDAEMLHLRHLSNLESLTLNPTTLTDAEVERLGRFPRLKTGELGLLGASEQAIARLRARAPDITIRRIVKPPVEADFDPLTLLIVRSLDTGDSIERRNGFDR